MMADIGLAAYDGLGDMSELIPDHATARLRYRDEDQRGQHISSKQSLKADVDASVAG